MNKWLKLSRRSSVEPLCPDHDIIVPKNRAFKKTFTDLIKQSEDKNKLVATLISYITAKLDEKGSPPPLSGHRDYSQYIAGIAYMLYKELKLTPQKKLSEIRKILLDNCNWKTNLLGEMQPNKEWGLRKSDFKAAITESILEYIEENDSELEETSSESQLIAKLERKLAWMEEDKDNDSGLDRSSISR